MSSQRVRTVTVITLQYTATLVADVLTVTTNAAHNLVTGNLVNLRFQNSPQEMNNIAVTVTGASIFTVSLTPAQVSALNGISAGAVSAGAFSGNPSIAINSEWGMSANRYVGQVLINYFNTGTTGRYIFTAPRGTGVGAVIQSFVAGTGGAVYALDGSLDGVHWTNIATITHGLLSGDTQSATFTPAWPYLSINITSIGAATTLTALYSS